MAAPLLFVLIHSKYGNNLILYFIIILLYVVCLSTLQQAHLRDACILSLKLTTYSCQKA